MRLPVQKIMISEMRAHMHDDVMHMLGIEDSSGLEIISLINIIANMYDTVSKLSSGGGDISNQRWALLMRLRIEEKRGSRGGITPTTLSHSRFVSKNTISSLVRGLEEQGLVERLLDPTDHRLFRIKLTPSGRELIDNSLPEHVSYLNKLASGLTLEERKQLGDLLEKFYCSMIQDMQITENVSENKSVYGG